MDKSGDIVNNLEDFDELPPIEGDFADPNALGESAPANKVTTYTGVNVQNFRDFLLKQELMRSITECGFEHPSEVQQNCIPAAISREDILCQAVSGMGKTAVFIISILQKLDENDPKPCSALILCNVRELAFQIKKEFDRFTKYLKNIRCGVVFGGVPIQENEKMFKDPEQTPHIVIGTPGRVLALAKKNILQLDNLEMFVLDECDKMLDESDMRSQVQQIFMRGNASRQVMMFSATMSAKTKDICRMYMKNPKEIFIDQEKNLTLFGLKQFYIKLEEEQKIKKLIQLLDDLDFNQVIIFVKTQEYAKKLNEIIRDTGFPSAACYSSMKIEDRLRVYNEFKAYKYRILVSTDLFGRGIDIEKINVVINYNMPNESDQYLHRVGRAGRFGTKGLAISFVSTDEDQKVLDDVQARFEVKVADLPTTIEKSWYMNN